MLLESPELVGGVELEDDAPTELRAARSAGITTLMFDKVEDVESVESGDMARRAILKGGVRRLGGVVVVQEGGCKAQAR
jgi:hypothetical protein